MSAKDTYRCFQLKVMGWIAIILPPLAILLVMAVHGLPFPMSISETATIAWRTDFLLPLCLGALAIFSLTYCIEYSYNNTLEKILTASMFAGFLIVAVQICASPYIEAYNIGLLGVSQRVSHIIHCIGAVGGFGALILWVLLCFTKSDKPKKEQTSEKRARNEIYRALGVCMIASLLLFAFDMFGLFGVDFPIVFVTEWVMLTFGGIACLLKGGLFFKDKKGVSTI
jgi:hypothetical protein